MSEGHLAITAAAAAAFRDRRIWRRRSSEDSTETLLMTEMVFFHPDAVNGGVFVIVPAIDALPEDVGDISSPPRHRHRPVNFPRIL